MLICHRHMLRDSIVSVCFILAGREGEAILSIGADHPWNSDTDQIDMAMKRFCCRWNLRTGSLVCAVWTLVRMEFL